MKCRTKYSPSGKCKLTVVLIFQVPTWYILLLLLLLLFKLFSVNGKNIKKNLISKEVLPIVYFVFHVLSLIFTKFIVFICFCLILFRLSQCITFVNLVVFICISFSFGWQFSFDVSLGLSKTIYRRVPEYCCYLWSKY